MDRGFDWTEGVLGRFGVIHHGICRRCLQVGSLSRVVRRPGVFIGRG